MITSLRSSRAKSRDMPRTRHPFALSEVEVQPRHRMSFDYAQDERMKVPGSGVSTSLDTNGGCYG